MQELVDDGVVPAAAAGDRLQPGPLDGPEHPAAGMNVGAAMCTECGASLAPGTTCQDAFHALLFRENEIQRSHPALFASDAGRLAHYFAVTCYAIQHPNGMGYTTEALQQARSNLARLVAGQTTLDRLMREVRASQGRVQRRAGAPVPDWRVSVWPYTVTDVLAAPIGAYPTVTRQWADSVLATLGAQPNA